MLLCYLKEVALPLGENYFTVSDIWRLVYKQYSNCKMYLGDDLVGKGRRSLEVCWIPYDRLPMNEWKIL